LVLLSSLQAAAVLPDASAARAPLAHGLKPIAARRTAPHAVAPIFRIVSSPGAPVVAGDTQSLHPRRVPRKPL
jgi:hypothetical protein